MSGAPTGQTSAKGQEGVTASANLQHQWRRVVDELASVLRHPGTTQAQPVTGLIVVRAPLRPQMLRLTQEATLALQSEIEKRLKDGLRETDHVGLLGPWEWLVTQPDLATSTPVVLAMLKIQRLISDLPLYLPASQTRIEFSIGAASHPDSGEDPQYLIQSARIAAMAADHLPDRFALYDPAMEATGDANQRHLDELKSAIGTSALQLYLQPQIDIAGGRCRHAEALLRWRLPDGTDVPAPDTIALVEQGGLRPRFNRWLVQQGVQSVARLDEAGVDISISLNLTANDLLDSELPDLVEHTLAFWNVEPRRVQFEITETIVVADTQEVIHTLDRLRSLGVRLAIDDFGTGYAGMSYLSRLPINEVKIDQSFIRRINESPTDYEIIASVTALAHRLGMEIVAEGVESDAVFGAVKALGCDRVQGYLFSRALPEADFANWWRQHFGQSSGK
jgi:diguanylate cyclase